MLFESVDDASIADVGGGGKARDDLVDAGEGVHPAVLAHRGRLND